MTFCCLNSYLRIVELKFLKTLIAQWELMVASCQYVRSNKEQTSFSMFKMHKTFFCAFSKRCTRRTSRLKGLSYSIGRRLLMRMFVRILKADQCYKVTFYCSNVCRLHVWAVEALRRAILAQSDTVSQQKYKSWIRVFFMLSDSKMAWNIVDKKLLETAMNIERALYLT